MVKVGLQARKDRADVLRVRMVSNVVVLRIKVRARGAKGTRRRSRVRVNGPLPTFVRPSSKVVRVDGRQAILYLLPSNTVGRFQGGRDSNEFMKVMKGHNREVGELHLLRLVCDNVEARVNFGFRRYRQLRRCQLRHHLTQAKCKRRRKDPTDRLHVSIYGREYVLVFRNVRRGSRYFLWRSQFLCLISV